MREGLTPNETLSMISAIGFIWYAAKGIGHYINRRKIERGEEKGGVFPIEYERKFALLPPVLEGIVLVYDLARILDEDPSLKDYPVNSQEVSEALISRSRIW